MKVMLMFFLLGVMFFVGCASNSRVELIGYSKELGITDSNTPVIFKGKAADAIAEQLANNLKTKQAMLSDVFKNSGAIFAGLILLIVGGFVFWGFTRSRYGWVVPAASVAGIFTMIFCIKFSNWIVLAVLVITVPLLVWKAVEYRNERNENAKKTTEMTDRLYKEQVENIKKINELNDLHREEINK